MDALVIANIEDATASSEFLKSQKNMIDEAYSNYNSYLYEGEMKSNSYMSMKQRVPMVMEFYLTPEELYTVEMYINPQKMSFSHNKLIQKQITRGGIFFHHYGEDTPKLTIQGNTGLSGMKGIEQIEKIFNYSGTLLRYQDVGINKIDNGIPEPRQIITLEDTLSAFNNNSLESIESNIELMTDQSNQQTLKSKSKANEIAANNLNVLYNGVEWTNKNNQIKSIIIKLNQLIAGKQYTYKQIYDMAYDLCLKETTLSDTAQETAFQIAYQLYDNEVSNVSNNITNVSNLNTNNINTNISNINNNITTGIKSAEVSVDKSNLVNVYKCVKATHLYSEPNFNANKISTLSVNGEFTSYVDNTLPENWVKHINGGYALTATPHNVVEIISNIKQVIYFCKDPTKGYTESNYTDTKVNQGGFFTYNATMQQDSAVTWYKHINGDLWLPSYIEGIGQITITSTYLELTNSNCHIYTAIRDDIKMYTNPVVSENNEVKENGKAKTLYKGGKFTATKIQGEWLQHINDGYWCQLSVNGVANFSAGYGNNITASTNVQENHMPRILTSNNNITLEIEKTKTDCKTAYEQYLSDILVWNKNSVIKRSEIESAFADIQDELTDEWLPRLVFLYFEDRVFIGHFDTFSYDRVAETENISYNMTFTIQRIISVTSIAPTRFEQSNNFTNFNVPFTIETQNIDVDDYGFEYYRTEYMNGNDIPLKIEILRTKCKYYYEKRVAEYSGIPMNEERKNQILNHHNRLLELSIYNNIQQLTTSTPIYGNVLNTTYQQYIDFMTFGYVYENNIYRTPYNELGRSDSDLIRNAQDRLDILTRIDGTPVTDKMLQIDFCIAKYNDIIVPELQRTNNIWSNESNMNYVDERRAANELSNAQNNALVDSITFMGTNQTLGALLKQYKTIDNIKQNVPEISDELDKVIAERGTEFASFLSLKQYTTSISNNRARQLFDHAENLIMSIGSRYANNSDFRQIYNNWLWQFNNYYGNSNPVPNTYKDKDAKITSTIKSNDVYERTMQLILNNKNYEFNVLNFSPTAKQNYAPIRYIIEKVLNCSCGWDASKKRAICISDNNKILLDIETYMHTTIDEKTGQTTSVAYSPISVLMQYLGINYTVKATGPSEATLRTEGKTNISSNKIIWQIITDNEGNLIDSKLQIGTNIKSNTAKENQQNAINQELKQEQINKEEQKVTITSDWDIEYKKDSLGNDFKIINQNKKMTMNVNEINSIEISGLGDISQKEYTLNMSIKNKIIKTIDTTVENNIMIKQIQAEKKGECTITFTREKGKKKDIRTLTIVII